MSTTNETPVRASAPEPLPDWINETPEHEETEYHLEVYNHLQSDQVAQRVELTREEFEWLKRSLAVHRGLAESSDSPEFMAECRAKVEADRAERAAQNGGSAPPVSKPEPPAERELPDWLTKAEPCSYTLVMYDPGGCQMQAVWMEHEEYENLKKLLACMRIETQGDYTGADVDEAVRQEMCLFTGKLGLLLKRAPAMVEAFGYLLAEEEEEEESA